MGAWPSKSKAITATSPPRPWAALTPKLVLGVFRRLSSHADRVRFASVCQHWRHIVKRFMRWSDLPPKVVDLVVRRLPDEADRIRFAVVCRHWRDVIRKFWSPWSCILPEFACLVLRRLMYSHADRVRFAAVCRHWRFVAGSTQRRYLRLSRGFAPSLATYTKASLTARCTSSALK